MTDYPGNLSLKRCEKGKAGTWRARADDGFTQAGKAQSPCGVSETRIVRSPGAGKACKQATLYTAHARQCVVPGLHWAQCMQTAKISKLTCLITARQPSYCVKICMFRLRARKAVSQKGRKKGRQ